MSSYLLDTDWIIDVLTGQETAIKTVLELAPAGLAVSIICNSHNLISQTASDKVDFFNRIDGFRV
jgi:hypothetical protein